jgi:hypothetical protein
VSAESSLLELCRATQHFEDEISKCKGARAEQVYLNYAERRSISKIKFQNAKEREQRQTYLSYAEQRSISIMKIKTQKRKNAKRIVSY